MKCDGDKIEIVDVNRKLEYQNSWTNVLYVNWEKSKAVMSYRKNGKLMWQIKL